LRSEVIDIRQFDARAFAFLLQVESLAWNKDLRWDYAPSAELIIACLEDKRLSGYALVRGNKIRGYSFFFYEGEKGLIGNLFVEPDGEGLNGAHLLLDHVLETLLGTPGIRRVEAQLPHFRLEELDPCFRRRGFQAYGRRFMIIPLGQVFSAPLLSPGTEWPEDSATAGRLADFAVVPWERKHDREAAQLLYLTYREHIDAVINDHYQTLEGAERLVEHIARRRGCGEMLPQASLVAIHRSSRKLAAILALTSVRADTGHIPQIAVATEFQGWGLGTTLIRRAFKALAECGYCEVSLTVTDANAGAVRLYERLGFETLRTFGAFVWDRAA
jgi:ribosomal protein S18 acetylase RimI-like enzyme